MLRLILLGMLLITCQLASAASPNVVVVLTDDQGWGDLSVHGLSLIHISEPTRPY